MIYQCQGPKLCDFSPHGLGSLLEVLYFLPSLLQSQVPGTLVSQASFPPCLGKPVGLYSRAPECCLPASKCH